MEDFLTKFHSLSGTTIGERRKNLFYLLNETKVLMKPEDLNFTLIEPKTSLEETFKVDILIYFKQIDELIRVLQNENPRLIHKVINVKKSLFNKMFLSVEPHYLVNEMFLQLSFSTKEKVLSKLASNLDDVEKADSIFFAVRARYGMHLATKLLPCCSQDVILTSVDSKIQLRQSQMCLIIKRNPGLFALIFDKLKKKFPEDSLKEKYKEVFKLVAQTDEEEFLSHVKEKRVVKRLGRRLTEKLVAKNKQGVIQSAQEIDQIVHRQRLAKSLSVSYHEFYIKLFPPTLAVFERDYNSYLDKLEKLPLRNSKFGVLAQCFEQKYGASLLNFSRFVTPKLLELMSQEERVAWMENRVKPSNMTDVVWTCLKGLHESVPELQKQINFMSNTDERAQLVGALVETCRINGKNKSALLEVSKYVLKYHGKNVTALKCFMKAVKKYFAKLEFDEEQWKCFKKIIDIVKGKKDVYNYYDYIEWFTSYMSFCYAQNKPIKDVLKKLFKENPNLYPPYYKTCTKQEMKFCKEYFVLLNEIITELYQGEDFKSNYCNYINSVVSWNQRQSSKIDLASLPNVGEYLQKFYETKPDGSTYLSISESAILYFAKSLNPDHSKLLDTFINRSEVSNYGDVYVWLMKHKPELISKHIVYITNNYLKLYYTLISTEFWLYSRNYHHLGIPQNITTVCLEQLSRGDTSDIKQNAIFALAIIMDSEDFLKLIAPYYPTEFVLDLTNKDHLENYQLQQSIIKSLKHLQPPSAALDSILMFSQGDYLKYVQRSLYSAAHNVPEASLPKLFDSLAQRAVSVRKHAVYLTLKVLNRPKVHELLNSLLLGEKNSSILKFLFKGTFRLFGQNPEDYLWDMLQKYAPKLHKEDKECYEFLLEVEKVPQAYRGAYVMFTWKLLPEFAKGDDLEQGKVRLLCATSKYAILDLTPEFLKQVVDEKFFKSSANQEAIGNFVCKFIIFAPNEIERHQRLEYVFNILQNCLRSEPNSKDICTRCLHFVKQFCSFLTTEAGSSSHEILAKFVDLWKTVWAPHDFFLAYLHLELSLIWTRPKPGTRVAQLCSSLSKLYGFAILQIFSAYLKTFILNVCNNYDFFPLYREILEECKNNSCLLLVISLLPDEVSFLQPHAAIYDQIINLLEQTSHPLIQLALHSYYKRIQDALDVNAKTEKPKTYFDEYFLPTKYEIDVDGF